MKNYLINRILPLIALSIPLTGLSAGSVNEMREMAADGRVIVENIAGSIEFSVWDEAKIEISGELGDDVERLEITESADGVHVRVHHKSNLSRVDDTDLYLKVPVAASVEAESVSADIDVDGSKGESIVVNTVSGDVDADASPQRIEVHSVSGDVEFEGAASRTSIETVSGEITVSGVSGEINVSTVSGDVSLKTLDVDRGRFESVSGDMKLELAIGDGGRLSSESMSGDLVLRLPSTQQASFVAQTYSGDIRSDFGETARGSSGPGSILEYREGNNGTSIRLESFSGDIHIRRQ
jgi:DUF4097 and DUF4098 domain-containing protein YvlB